MGKKYSTVLTGGVIGTYSDDNPADDGSKTADNRIKYSRIQSDLTSPLHSGIINMDTELLQTLDETPVAKAANYTTVTSDYAKVIEASGASTTISLLNPSGNDGYKTIVKNADSSNQVTVNVDGGALVDSQTSIDINPLGYAEFRVDAAGTGYLQLGASSFPSGTVMLFAQATAPVGWTIGSGTYNNRKVVIDDSNGTVTGGTDSPVSPRSSGAGGVDHTHTGTATGTTGDGGSHNHTGPSHTHVVGGNTSTHPGHTHTTPSHNHAWYIRNANSVSDQTYNSGGSATTITDSTKDPLPVGISVVTGAEGDSLNQTSYTSNSSGTSGSGGVHNHSWSDTSAASGTGVTSTASNHTHSFSDSFTTSTASSYLHTHNVGATNYVKVITASKD